MNLNMTFKHMDTSEAIKTFTREKSEKLSKYFDGKVSLNWNFSMEHKAFIAHCHLVGNNMDYFGESTADDLHQSVDQAIEKIEKQLRKHKEIVTNHLHHAATPASETEEAAD